MHIHVNNGCKWGHFVFDRLEDILLSISFPEIFFYSNDLSIFLTARLAAPEVADRDLAESVLSSIYWGRENDLDIEYSLILQQNANLMLAHCLRRWLNSNPTLVHETSRVW